LRDTWRETIRFQSGHHDPGRFGTLWFFSRCLSEEVTGALIVSRYCHLNWSFLLEIVGAFWGRSLELSAGDRWSFLGKIIGAFCWRSLELSSHLTHFAKSVQLQLYKPAFLSSDTLCKKRAT
jgi:hypothetical protein